MRWPGNSGRNIIQPERRDEVVASSLEILVQNVYPNMRMTAPPAKRRAKRLLVEIVDLCTRLVRENRANDPLAGIGLAGVCEWGWNPYDWEDESFLEQARLGTECDEPLQAQEYYRWDRTIE